MQGRRERGSRLTRNRVRTLTGKEIELDIEPDYRVCFPTISTKLADKRYGRRDGGLTKGEGIANQRESRGEGGYPACTAAVDLWWEANVCPSILTFYKAARHLCLELERLPG